MQIEVTTKLDDLLVRKLILEPGEAVPWHTDTCHRFSVILRGEQLRIEFRDSDEQLVVPVRPGTGDWDLPDGRVHRAVNTGATPYEEIVTFFLAAPEVDPQPEHT